MPAGGIFHGSMSSMAPEREQAAQGPSFRIRAMDSADADQVLAIYQAGLDTGDASFEIRAPTWEDFSRSRLPDHRIVAEDMLSRRVLGWAACIRVSDRCAYAGVVEHSVYVAPAHQRMIAAHQQAHLVGQPCVRRVVLPSPEDSRSQGRDALGVIRG